MAHINLLPWREELRKQKKRDYFILLGMAAFAMVLVVAYIHFYMVGMIENQEAKNNFLQAEIKKVEAQIKEIEDLEKQKAALIARMQVIDQLQKNRPEVVHMFDEMARMVPEGLYLTKIVQKERVLTIEGMAQSNARVSAFMRAMDESEWFTEPVLDVIQTTNDKSVEKLRTFKLRVKQKTVVVGVAQ